MAVEPLAKRRIPRGTLGIAPWGINAIITIYISTGLGLTMIMAGWWGASGTTDTSDQVAWTTVSIGGLIIAGTGNALWLLHGRRTIAEQQRLLLSVPAAARVVEALGPQESLEAKDVLVATNTMTRYHRPDCPLVAGKSVKAAGLREHEKRGRRPCGVCSP